MANVIKHKRGSGSDPVANDLVVGEVAIRTDVGKLFTKMDNGSVAEIAGGGSDIAINTLSSSSGTGGGSATFNGSAYRFTLSAPPSVSAQQLLVSINGVIQKPVAGTGQPSEGFSVDGTDIILGDAPATGSDFFILTFKSLGVSEPADNSVTSAKIADGAIVNADINASAAIAGTKISPDFGSQNVVTTGTLGSGNITISNNAPSLFFTEGDANPDYQLLVNGGQFRIYDVTNTTNRLVVNTDGHVDVTGNLDVGAGIDITGAITGTGDLTIDTNTLHVDSSNNRVGIGTNSPSNNLEVASANHTGILIQSDRTTASDNIGAVDFRSSSTDVARIQSLVDGTIKFRNTSALTERMRIDSSGRVLIGQTSSNNSTSMLQLKRANNNTIRLANSDATATNFVALDLCPANSLIGARIVATADGTFSSGSAEDAHLKFFTTADGTSSERMRIDSSGNVGIGTTSPDRTIHCHNSSNTTNVRNKFSNGTTGEGASDGFEIGINGSDPAQAVLVNYENSPMAFFTNATERMRIDSSGNVGIGVTSVSSKLHLDSGGASTGIQIDSDTESSIDFNDHGGSAIRYRIGTNLSDNNSQFEIRDVTNDASRMRIDSSGNVGIGTTSPDRLLDVVKGGTNVARFQQTTNNQGSDHACITLRHAAATASAQGVGMNFQNTGGSEVGSIRFGSSTSYNTSSDYRLKENVVAISDGITRLKTLKPSRFNFIADADTTVDGFLAHEVTAVPEAITGTKDEVDSDNNPVYQGIDQSKLVPLLVAALQEAIGRIEALEAK